jgi:hypothetical protein
MTSIAVAAVGAALLAPGASADPSNAKSAGSFAGDCGGTIVDFVVNGNGVFTPAHDAGSTRQFIPQSFDLTFEFTETGASEPSFSEHDTSSHANPHGNLVTCSFDVEDVSPEGTFTVVGTATGFFTPSKKR